MKVKRFLCLFFVFCMSLTLCVPVFALGPESVEIAVNNEQDILEFIFSDEFDSDVAYTFVYPDAPVKTRALCSNCGYNTLVGKTVERYDLCHPDSQGATLHCPDFYFAPCAFNAMLTYVYQYCNTCGYKSQETFSESKYYIDCTFKKMRFIATDYKTRNRIGDSHEWKDTWSFFYNDPHA